MARDLLVEIGTEEIPPSYLEPAAHCMRDLLLDLLSRNRVSCGRSRVCFTPRRFALRLEGVSEHQQKLLVEVFGPPVSVAFDAQGNPTKAALGFARAQGVPVAQLKVKETERGEVVCCRKTDEGVETPLLLKELLPQMVKGVEFPKSMRWEKTGLRFARPIRWVVALFGSDVVEFDVASLRSGRETRPHRSQEGTLFLREPSEYEKVLKAARVVVDPECRRQLISEGIEAAAGRVGGRAVEDPDLVSEVTNMAEYPTVLLGRFDRKYLNLPSKVVITALREHQRYFAVENSEGSVLPYFMSVADSPDGDEETIRLGNQRILASRLEDAEFYWEADRKEEFWKLVERLKGVVWQEGLGSLYDKTQRVVDLTEWLFHKLGQGDLKVAKRAAYLSKADLVTSMVRDGKEFTKLQGVMGREYALASGEDPRVAQAIYEHYLPRFPGDELPSGAEGAMISLADKADTICGFFARGTIPSGSQDPFGLRRHANGVVALLVGRGWHVSLADLVEESLGLLSRVRDLASKEGLRGAILQFFTSRVEKFLEEQGISYDIAKAVVAVKGMTPVDARASASALSSLRGTPDFENLVLGQKRVANILQGVQEPSPVDESLFEEDAERHLYERALGMQKEFSQAIQEMEHIKALELLLTLRQPIDRLFDDVLIMTENESLRSNRLGLLSLVSKLFLRVADFSEIVLEGEQKRGE